MKVKGTGTAAALCFVASLLFYIVAFISRLASSDTSMTVIWICLGSAFLCLGAVQKNKRDKDTKK